MTNQKFTGLRNDVSVESLFGHQLAPAKIVLAGMKDLEKELTKNFKTRQDNRSQREKYSKLMQKSFLDSLNLDDENAKAVKALKEMHIRQSRIKLEHPKMLKESQRIFPGSIGATVVPPFNYQWTWSAGSGSPSDLTTAANASTGQMSFFTHTNFDHASSGSVRSALGIYFRPMTDNGILNLWANPAINYNWWDYCAFADAHTDGFIGLYVGRYNLSGGFDGAPVNQQIGLWSDSSWWSGGDGSGSNSGYPLSAQFNVDRSHWYALWVWTGGNVSADGWHTFSGSGAGAGLSATVPSMTWELF